MRILSIALLSLALASANGVSSAQEAPAARISAYTGAVSEAQLRADLTTLVGFGTRHTLSDTVSETRGIGAARRWIARRFDEISATCGKCLDIQLPAETITLAPRIPNPTEVVNVIAIQKGTGDPNNVVFIMGHYDSRVSDVLNATADAPGANDDGSGTVAVIEAARVLSQHKFPATIVYAALAGKNRAWLGLEYWRGM
jgi:Predicted aminopeptidases